MHKPTIFIVQAHAGSGKTHSAHQFIAANPDEFFTIATQTTELSEQQKRDLKKLGVKAKVISLETTNHCGAEYVRHCEDRRKSVALINQKVALQMYSCTAHQTLIIDEYFSPVEKFTLVEDHSASWETIRNLVSKAVKTEYPGYLEILPTDEVTEIADEGRRKQSSLASVPHIRDFCNRTDSLHYRVFVAEDNYKNFQSNVLNQEQEDDEGGRPNRKLTLYAWMQPSIVTAYKKVVAMGANFAHTKLSLYWGDKVNFVAHPSIKGKQYEDFSHKAEQITFRHLSEDDVSMYRLEQIGYQKFADECAKVIEAAYPLNDYLVTLSAKKPFVWCGEDGEKISPNPMGLNSYQDDYHMAVHLAPLNPSFEDEEIWLAVAGVTSKHLMLSQAYEMQYQFFTRTSVRKKKCPEELVFIALDRRSADAGRAVFGVQKHSELLPVLILTDYVKPPRKTRSDKKTTEEKRATKTASQKERRAKERAKKQMPAEYCAIAAE